MNYNVPQLKKWFLRSFILVSLFGFQQVGTAQILCDTLFVEAGNDVSICKGDDTQLQASSHNSWYEWSPANSLSNPLVADPVASPIQTTTYYVTVTDNDGCFGVDSVTVTVECPTILNPLDYLSTCTGSSVPVSLELSEDIDSYSIITTGGYSNVSITGSTISFDAILTSIANTFEVELVGVGGCSTSDEFVVLQTSMPESDFVIIPPSCVDNPATIIFLGTASPAAILDWNVDDGSIIYSSPANATMPAGAEIHVVWPTFGGKLVTLNVNDGGCEDLSGVGVYVNKSPICDLGPDTVICKNECVTIGGCEGYMMYMWNDAAGVDPDDFSTTEITICPDTTTQIILTVMNEEGCMTSDTVNVVVSCPDSDPGDDLAICLGEEVQLNATGGVVYEWSPADGLSCTDCADPIASPTETTTYTLKVTDQYGCMDTDEITITVNPLPTADAGPDMTICFGDDAILNGSGGVVYEWTPATGLSCTDCAMPTASPMSTTTYTLKVTDANGCMDTDDVTVTVNPLPTADAGPDVAICDGESTQLQASGGVTYFWMPPAGLSCTMCPDPVATPTATTTYTVIVMDINGCMDADDVTVTVNPNPDVDAGPDVRICEGESTDLVATGAVTYSWSPATGLSCTDCPNPTASPSMTTTYTVVGTDANGCEDTDEVEVVVIPLPTIDAGPDVTICIDSSTQLMATGGLIYSWSPATGLSCTDCADPIASPTVTTTYTVVGEDMDGCENSDEVTVTVATPPDVTLQATVATCDADDGTIMVMVDGGTPDYTICWEGPESGTITIDGMMYVITELPAGEYCVIVKDEAGCVSDTSCITILNNPGNVMLDLEGEDATCGNTDGKITYTVSGFMNSYDLYLDGMLIVDDGIAPMGMISDLAPGTYMVMVIDDKGCEDSGSIDIGEEDPPVIDPNDIDAGDVSCNGLMDGYIHSLSATVYMVFDAADMFIGLTPLDNLGAGSYTVKIEVASCSAEYPVTISEPSPLDVQVQSTDAECCMDGTITLTVSGGSPDYTYNWDPNVSATNMATGLTPGMYSITVTDTEGCEETVDVTIANNCDCPEIFPEDTICVGPDDFPYCLCIPIHLDDIVNYDVFLNGTQVFPDHGCDFETVTVYSYSVLVGAGQDGPYIIDSWTVNGTMYNDTVQTMTELVDLMNTWDPTGDWELLSSLTSIGGGDPNNTYGNIEVTHVSSWISATMMINTTGVALGTKLDIPDPICNEVIIYDPVTCCSDTVYVKPCDDCDDFIAISSKTITTNSCPDIEEYICLDVPFAEVGDYTVTLNGGPYMNGMQSCLGGDGVELLLNEEGLHQIIFTHNMTDCKDTVLVEIICNIDPCQDFIELKNKTHEYDDCDDIMVALCIDVPYVNYNNYTVTDNGNPFSGDDASCDSGNGTALTFTEGGLHTIVFSHNLTQCTDTVFFDIICTSTGTFTVYAGGNDMLDMNDHTPPDWRFNNFGNGGTKYSSTVGESILTGGHYISYAGSQVGQETIIVNATDAQGKSRRLYFTIEVLERELAQNELEVMTGFSPNNDGNNDFFTIKGLENYASNELSIFDRWGQRVFFAKNYQNDWTGTFRQGILPQGTYFYALELPTGEIVSGYVYLKQ